MSARRVSNRQIPDQLCECTVQWQCVYRKEGKCDMPRTYRGNSDAACHSVTPKYLLWQLTIIKQGGAE